MTSWQTKKLGELSKVQTGPFGAQLHEKDYVKTNGTPIITVENLSGGIVKLLQSTPLVSDSDKARLHRYVLREGDIVFSRVGSVDRSAYVTRSADGWMFSGRLLRVHPSEKLDAKYLNYHLNNERTKNLIRNLAVGGTMPSLNTEILNFVPIHFPEKPEQERIVEVLEVWDEYIEKLEQKIALKEQLKNGLMQQLLIGKLRLPGFVGNWQTRRVSELVDVKKGSGLSKDTLSSDGAECVLYGEIYTKYDEIIDSVESRTLTKTGVTSKSGDILIPASTTTSNLDVATAACITKSGVLLGGDINILRPKVELNGEFIALLLSRAEKYNLAKRAQGITIVHLYGKDVAKMKISIPDTEEQDEIVKIYEIAREELRILKNELSNLKQQKKYLLKNLITGTIRTPEDLKPLVQGGVKS